MNRLSSLALVRLGAVVAVATVVPACEGELESVSPNVVVVGTATSALSGGDITSINGTYTTCTNRIGTWSLRVSGVAPLDHTALSVVKDDASCILTVTDINAGGVNYTGTPAIALGTSYAGAASSFAPFLGAVGFTGNAKIDSTSFASNFQITFLYSEDLRNGGSTDVTPSAYTTVEASVVTQGVPAPDYTMSLSTGTPFTFQMNALKVVTSASGNATLIDDTVAGTNYVVDNGTLPASPTYANVQTTYALAATLGQEKTLSGSNPTIPAANFNLVGQTLLLSNVVRNVIVSRTVNGVKAYEIFKVTFKAQ